jgi:hypothetical protein
MKINQMKSLKVLLLLITLPLLFGYFVYNRIYGQVPAAHILNIEVTDAFNELLIGFLNTLE